MELTPAVIELVVTDMARALAFYRRLGLPVPEADAGAEHVEVPLPGGLVLAFDTHDTIRAFDPAWTLPPAGRRVTLAFRCGSVAEVDEAYAQLTAEGHPGHQAPWDAFWGQRYAVVLDPDGNPVDLFADLPGADAAG